MELRNIAGLAQSAVPASERSLPVLKPFDDLLANKGLQRGITIAVDGTFLALGLIAKASQAGSWSAVVGMPSFGAVAAHEVGVVLERLALVPAPSDQWSKVAAALLDALDVVLLFPGSRVRISDARRLTAKARERGSVLVIARPQMWPEPVHLNCSVVNKSWIGIGNGYGCLRGCRVEVMARGKAFAARERRRWLWLPDELGRITSAEAV